MPPRPRRYGAAKVDDLQESVSTAPQAGVGDAFSFARAAGRAIDQVRFACTGYQLPPDNPTVITYIFCDDLEAVANQNIFEDINLVWTSDTSIQLCHIENRIVLISRNGGAGCKSKGTYLTMKAQADAITQLQLSSASAIIFQLSASKATVFPNGIGSGDHEHRPFGTVSSLLLGQELELALKHFDDNWVNAPLGHAKVWANVEGHTYVPEKNTEKVIQEQMQLALAMVDTSGVVVAEIPNPEGRADLWLFSDTPGGRHSVVLELKVLRSFSFPAKRKDRNISSVSNTVNADNAKEVVQQAHRYKTTMKAQRSCAHLYDMRKPPANPEVVTDAQSLADSLSVELRVSPIHYTAKLKRDDKVAQELAGQAANNGQ